MSTLRHRTQIRVQHIRSMASVNAHMSAALTQTAVHRAVHGPRCPGWSWRLELAVSALSADLMAGGPNPVQAVRRAIDQAGALPLPWGVQITPVTAGLRPAEWIEWTGGRQERALLYLHGGGYIFGSLTSHRGLIAQLARAADMRALALDYRLAPEHPYPAAWEDAFAAYWWLLEQGIDPARLVVAGESAGGGLTVALMLMVRDAGLPLPAACVCISPWVDLTLSAPSLLRNAATDYLNPAAMRTTVGLVLAGHDPRTPLISPIFADLHGLPPLLIQAGTAEVLLDDAARLAQRAAADGVAVAYEPWENMVHAWHVLYSFEPAARAAINRIGQFVRCHIAPNSVTLIA